MRFRGQVERVLRELGEHLHHEHQRREHLPRFQKSTCLTQLILGPCMVQIWSRYARNFEATKPSSSTEWLRELWEHPHHKYQRREHLPDSISGLVLSSPGTRPLCLALCCRNWRLEAPKMVHSVDSGLGPKHWERTRAATSKKLWLARRGNIYFYAAREFGVKAKAKIWPRLSYLCN